MNEFIPLTLVAALIIVSPGPNFAIVMQNSLTHGRRSGVYASCGIGLANLCHVTLNLLGIGVIISKSILAFTLLKIFGGAYLLYLGYKGLRSKPALNTPSAISMQDFSETNKNYTQGFYSGFFTSLLNPKACLFFLSFFSVFLSPETEFLTQILYGVWISSLDVIWFILVSIFFTHSIISRKLETMKHWIDRVTGGVLVLLGLKLFSSEVVP